MASLNYAVFGPKFSMEGTFRVLRMESFPSEAFYFDEVEECGVSIESDELKKLILKANSLQFVDFGNGLRGIFCESDGFHFCAVSQYKESAITEPQQESHSEDSDTDEIF